MKGLLRRRERVGGEVVLATATAADGTRLAGTREALHLGERRIPWEGVETADWDRDTGVWRVVEVGGADREPVRHAFVLDDPRRFLALALERITATVVLQRHVALRGRRGFRVIARRPASGATAVTWVVEYDAGIDPEDEAVRDAVARELDLARVEVGLD